jgi:uncharacterized membrane protein
VSAWWWAFSGVVWLVALVVIVCVVSAAADADRDEQRREFDAQERDRLGL